MSLDTPNSQKKKQREELNADVERYLAQGGTIHQASQGYSPIANGPDQADIITSTSAAALLGFSQTAIKQSFRTGKLGGHPAPEFIYKRTGHPVFMREVIYQWRDKYGKGGTKIAPEKERAA